MKTKALRTGQTDLSQREVSLQRMAKAHVALYALGNLPLPLSSPRGVIITHGTGHYHMWPHHSPPLPLTD
ncbi:hypothetical protein CICLE_v10024670mg [Citrus x clementina]|uniref:Uncharacterized protein n=1 Tax=Citrus clementina TaxID=85681 RepID=V4TVV5_CITCL|nr:hypothetical protein CICLE_v10024670mg [Citrus x clementina]